MAMNLFGRPALLVAAGLVLAFALGSAWLTPRGPVTTTHALATMAVALAVGLVVGAATGSRWALLLAPAAFVAVFELARMGSWGPTVDAPASAGMLHVLSFLMGRAPQWLLTVVPMLLGTLVGLALAPRFGVLVARPMGVGGWVAASALAIVVVAVAVVVARPATTAPILGTDGDVVPGSIAELTTAEIGGHEQALMIRGRSTDLPVLLHLAGGPGGTDIGAMRLDTGLEERFVVVTWDQRGSGKSYPAFGPAETLTLEQVVADTIELSEVLAARFGRERIYIAGQSWGTIPATLAAHRRPELYHALITTGQMVDIRETDLLFYDDTLVGARARRHRAGRAAGGDGSAAVRRARRHVPPHRRPRTLAQPVPGVRWPHRDDRDHLQARVQLHGPDRRHARARR